MVKLLNGLDIFMQDAAVEDFPLLHAHAIIEFLRLLHSVASDFNIRQHGVFQHMEGDNDTFRHFLKRGENIIEIARVVNGVPGLIEQF